MNITGGNGMRFNQNIGVGSYPTAADSIYAFRSVTDTGTERAGTFNDVRLEVTSATRTAASFGTKGYATILAANTQDVSGDIVGCGGLVDDSATSGTMSNIHALRAGLAMDTGGTITNYYAVRSTAVNYTAGTLTNAYGFRHDGFGTGTNKWAISVAADPCKFMGVGYNIEEKTGAYTADDDDHVITCDASGGAFTVTLPALSGRTGRVYHIKKIDSSVNAVTVDGNASENIDGSATVTLAAQYDCIMICAGASEWHIIG